MPSWTVVMWLSQLAIRTVFGAFRKACVDCILGRSDCFRAVPVDAFAYGEHAFWYTVVFVFVSIAARRRTMCRKGKMRVLSDGIFPWMCLLAQTAKMGVLSDCRSLW